MQGILDLIRVDSPAASISACDVDDVVVDDVDVDVDVVARLCGGAYNAMRIKLYN